MENRCHFHENVATMSNFLSFLNPARYTKPIEDPNEVKKQYEYWRMRVFYSMYLGYAAFYFSRKSLSSALPAVKVDLGLCNDQLGLFTTVFATAYGISKFTSGIIVDRSNPRVFMALGLIFTGIWNLCFGFSSSMWAFLAFWGLNGWFQGFGWPGCVRLLTHWYSKSERGRWWGLLNTSMGVGAWCSGRLAGWCAEEMGWRYALYIPGVLSIGFGLMLLNRLRDTPQSLGLPPIEVYRNDHTTVSRLQADKKIQEKELSPREILFKYVLSSPYIWMLGISYFFVYVIRSAVYEWGNLFLVEDKGYTISEASKVVSWFEAGGMVGSLAAGWASDWIFKGRRGPINVLFMLGCLVTTFLFWSSPIQSYWWDMSMMALFGFFIFGPQMLVGMAAAEYVYKKAAATANGFTGTFAYIGVAAAGYPMGLILEKYQWNGLFATLAISSIIATLILIPFCGCKKKNNEI